jgi:hypothetical protein
VTDCGKDVTKAYRDANITFAENPYAVYASFIGNPRRFRLL